MTNNDVVCERSCDCPDDDDWEAVDFRFWQSVGFVLLGGGILGGLTLLAWLGR